MMRWSPRLASFGFAFAIICLAPAWVSAQSAFSGIVKDTTGAILPGVTIEAASPVLIEKVRSTVSDDQGRYNIVDLRPGTYTLTFTLPGFSTFKRDVVNSKLALHALLKDLKRSGARIFGVGAPSRASTLISYVGLDDGILDCVLEVKGSYKVGKYMPGTLIPVVDEARLFEEQPEYALLLSWHIADELAPKLTDKGFKGRYIVPLPTPRIL